MTEASSEENGGAPDEEAVSSQPSPDDPDADEPTGASEREAAADPVYCTECGWENPAGANYCSRCGTELQVLEEEQLGEATRPVTADLPDGPSSAESSSATIEESDGRTEEAAMGQQIAVVVGTAVVLVLGLFFVTQWSQQYTWGDGTASGDASSATTQQQARTGPSTSSESSGRPRATDAPSDESSAEPADLQTLVNELSGSVNERMADQIDSLRALVEGAEDRDRRRLRAKLSQLYVGAGAPGRAAVVQQALADQTGRIEDRRRAADLLYKWLRQVEAQGDRTDVGRVARHVAEAYSAVVQQRPQDLDARTRMGEAYLLTNNPMKGIRAINRVLKADSTFVPARFQKGLALLQINRLNEAVQQFEKVRRDASQDDPFYRQAERAIEVIRRETSSGSSASGESAP